MAEDNDDEFVLLRCAFESSGFSYRLIGVANGAEALDYLYAQAGYSNRVAYPFPDLTLLDLHMPVLNGFEVLEAVGKKFEFESLPLVVLTSDDDEFAKWRARKLGAKDYILKPLTMAERIDMVRGLHLRWLADRKKPASEGTAFNAWGVRLPGRKPKGKTD